MASKEVIKPEELPPRENFIEWYNKVLELAEIADRRYPVKGTFVWLPYGLKLMKNLVREWDALFQENGIEEVYFPLFVPIDYLKINEEWYEGFKDHIYYVRPPTRSEELYALRPTGEPAMYPIFRLWIKEGKLPIRVYQTVSSFRYESKTTHTMIRDREITYWYEIHTVHKTKEEAEEEVRRHIKINDYIWEKILCIPPIKAFKPPWEIFPGAVYAIEYYTILPNGRLLENGSVNNLGQAYAKKFELVYVDEKGEKKYCWQVCTGNGARYLVAVISIHGDERGLVLPPRIAPIQVIIIPIHIGRKDVLEEAFRVKEYLEKSGVRVQVDDRSDITPGEKFHIWDIKGVPIRIEVGARELEQGVYTVYRRDLKVRTVVVKDKLLEHVTRLLKEEIPRALYNRAKEFYASKIRYFEDLDVALEWILKGGVAKANICESRECYETIMSLEKAVEPIGYLYEEEKSHKCIVCGKPTSKLTLFGKVY